MRDGLKAEYAAVLQGVLVEHTRVAQRDEHVAEVLGGKNSVVDECVSMRVSVSESISIDI